LQVPTKTILIGSISNDYPSISISLWNGGCSRSNCLVWANNPRLKLSPIQTSQVSLQIYDPVIYQNFAAFFQRTNTALRLQPFSSVLTNVSTNAIQALTVRWAWVDASGHKQIHDYTVDGFFINHNKVLPAGRQLLVTPSFVLPDSLVDSGFIGPNSDTLQRDADAFEHSTENSVSVDTVIFEDGRVIGPDVSRTVASIQSRTAAIKAVLDNLQAATDQGLDPSAALSALAQKGRGAQGDYLQTWTTRIAHLLLQHSSDPDRSALVDELKHVSTVTFRSAQ
jgi:hypothetical protein